MLKRIMLTAAAFLMAAGTMFGGLVEIKPMDGVTKPSSITYISRNDYDDPVYFGDSTGGLYFCIDKYKKVPTLHAAPVKRIVHCSNYMSDPLLGPIVYYNETDIDAKLNILYGSPITYSTMCGSKNIGPTCKFNDLACNGDGLYALNSNSDGEGCTIFKYSNKGGTADWLEGLIHPTNVFFVKLLSSEHDLFGVTKDGKVYRIDFNGQQIYLLGYAKDTNSVACASNGALWLRNVVGDYYLPPGSSTWLKLANSCPLTDMACEPIFHYGRVWVAGRNGDIYATKCDTDQWELICKIPNVTCMGYNGDAQFFGTSDGKIYLTELVPSWGTVDFVSDVPHYPNDAIYRITIQGAIGLNQDQLFFGNGLNGFSYRIYADGQENGPYAADAYPITGLEYSDKGGTKATLTPRSISFLWKGPKCRNKGEHTVTIIELVNSNPGSSDSTVLELKRWADFLPTYTVIPGAGVTIKLNTGANSLYCTGVSATPFDVVLVDSITALPIPLNDPRYNNLTFWVNEGGLNYSKVIGCNPLDKNTDYLAIIPAEFVEIGGKPRYGMASNSGSKYYKRFYLFCGYNNKNSVSIGVQLGDTTVNATNYTRDDSGINAIFKPISTYNSKGGAEYKCTLQGGTEISNFAGDTAGSFSGYLDYALIGENPKNGEIKNKTYDNVKKGVYALFPQGINPLGFVERLNPAKMQVGYFLQPDARTGLRFNATECYADVNSDYCLSMQGKNIYACVFDIHGRHVEPLIRATGQYVRDWNESNDYDNCSRQRIRVGNYSKVPICMNVVSLDPASCVILPWENADDAKNDDNHNNFGLTEKYKGVFLPPGKEEKFASRIYAFLANYSYRYVFTGCSPFTYPETKYFQSQVRFYGIYNGNWCAKWEVNDHNNDIPFYNSDCKTYSYLQRRKDGNMDDVRMYWFGVFYSCGSVPGDPFPKDIDYTGTELSHNLWELYRYGFSYGKIAAGFFDPW